MKVHFSVDDITKIWSDITFKEYDSVFEQPILAQMKALHDIYGAKFSLYCFADQEINLRDVTERYHEELSAQSDWLRFGFHAYDKDSNYKDAKTEKEVKEFYEDLKMVQEEITRIAGENSISQVIRLHFFTGSREIGEILKQEGIRGLMAADDERISYYLSEEENRTLRDSKEGYLRIDGMEFYRTDIRYEREDDILAALDRYREQDQIVVFTHEHHWENNWDKIRLSMEWMKERKAEFWLG